MIFGLLLLVVWLSFINPLSLMRMNLQKIIAMVLLIPLISIFPDVDIRQSKSRRLLSIFISLPSSLLYILLFPESWYYGLAYFFILYFLVRFFPTKHRGATHSFKFMVVFSLAITFLLYFAFNFSQTEFLLWFMLFLSTYFLHLTLDRL